MSESDLAPFVAAVIEDGIVAEMQHKIEELESKIKRREENHLKVQITGRNGGTTYGEYSLKDHGSLDGDDWHLDMRKKIVDGNILKCVCPFDKESITQLEIHVGGIVLLKPFLTDDDQFHCTLENRRVNDVLGIRVVFEPVSINTPIEAIFAQIVLASSSSTSIDDKEIFSSLIRSYYLLVDSHPQEVLRHFDTLITTNGEGEGGTKLTMTLEQIYFRKDSISGCISLLDELGVQTSRKRPLLTSRE